LHSEPLIHLLVEARAEVALALAQERGDVSILPLRRGKRLAEPTTTCDEYAVTTSALVVGAARHLETKIKGLRMNEG
jgi:hypothetical protein